MRKHIHSRASKHTQSNTHTHASTHTNKYKRAHTHTDASKAIKRRAYKNRHRNTNSQVHTNGICAEPTAPRLPHTDSLTSARIHAIASIHTHAHGHTCHAKRSAPVLPRNNWQDTRRSFLSAWVQFHLQACEPLHAASVASNDSLCKLVLFARKVP